ncbi:dienelactone-like hydrolase [Chloropicon roscoffensis]|uniref:Dienelactone-like hydrolase n=1 Tax=Chloropicon roscoffensis TaxID=1461544 RepID=A0A7S3CGG6_9CHLO|mmetsp:Transcript_9422/g.28641  ORF Transcript_9422/g.28641 Transcript_9422/m.28641 type:complete len:253 (+) Transcript_9422:96-854(+)
MTTKACCDAGLPAKSTGEPIGKVFDLASSPAGKPLPCYEVGSGDRAVIVAYDIFGFTENKRTRLVCDQIAAAGMRVIMPDFYRGTDVLAHFKTFPPEGGIPAVIDWVTGVAPFDTVIEELFEVVVKYLESTGVRSIGMIGFCWGGKVVMLASKRGKIKGGVSCHPAFLEPEDGANADCPQFFMPAGDDPPIDPVFNAMKSKPFFDKCKKKVYSDQPHGWVLRSDMSDPTAKAARDANDAVELAIEFLDSVIM